MTERRGPAPFEIDPTKLGSFRIEVVTEDDPARKVPKGFETEKTGVGMASYLGVMKDHEIDSVILYIKTLAEKKKR